MDKTQVSVKDEGTLETLWPPSLTINQVGWMIALTWPKETESGIQLVKEIGGADALAYLKRFLKSYREHFSYWFFNEQAEISLIEGSGLRIEDDSSEPAIEVFLEGDINSFLGLREFRKFKKALVRPISLENGLTHLRMVRLV